MAETAGTLDPNAMAATEALRSSYRPNRITTLFVGESAPASGAFFYDGDNTMVTYFQRATDIALPGNGDFLARFRDHGWYLDDLVLEPVNHLKGAPRRAACRAARDSLSARIAEYQPLAIVVVLLAPRVKDVVFDAARRAGTTAALFAVPFPGMGWQGDFHTEMQRILPALPKAQ
jgi:hypothetical protein